MGTLERFIFIGIPCTLLLEETAFKIMCVCSIKYTTISIKLDSCIDCHVVINTSVFCGNSCRGSVVKNNTVPLFSPSLCLTHSFGHDNEVWVVFIRQEIS